MSRQEKPRTVTSWAPQVGPDRSPKYLAIAEALAADIRSGRLGPGERLPPQRALARRLGVDLTTVTRAFNEARRQGLVEGAAGRGTFVRAPSAPDPGPAAEAGATVDLSMNAPPQPPEAQLAERLREGVGGVLVAPGGLTRLHYQESAGAIPDRAAGARWLARRLGPVSPDRVLVAAGAQSALFAIVAALLQPGDALCAGALTYPGLRAVAEQRGVRLVPVPLDEEGLDPDAFEAACRRERPRALYCVPTLDNPTTATLPAGRREAIVAAARRHGVVLVEDDAYGALPSEAPAPLAALAPEIAWHVASLSKCATPALRVAYVAAPDLAGTLRLAAEVRATILMAPPLMAALASRWALDGTLEAVTAAIRRENEARQRLAREVLAAADFDAHPQGHHLWLRLPGHWRRAEFVAHARRSGLSLVASDDFAVVPSPPEAVRVSLGVARDCGVLERALGLLSALLARRPAAVSTVV
jgi:DNA-binding transcriptional MocR family regulator